MILLRLGGWRSEEFGNCGLGYVFWVLLFVGLQHFFGLARVVYRDVMTVSCRDGPLRHDTIGST
jgi:hypothetical protein